MGFFNLFSKKVSDVEIDNKLKLLSDFVDFDCLNISSSNVLRFRKFCELLILFEKKKTDFSNREFERFFKLFNLLFPNFKIDIFKRKIIPVELVMALSCNYFNSRKNKDSLVLLEYYDFDKNFMYDIIKGGNVGFIATFDKVNFVDIPYNTLIKYDILKKLISKLNLLYKIYQLKNSVNSIGQKNLNLFFKYFNLDDLDYSKYFFELNFVRVFHDTNEFNFDQFCEGNILLNVYYKNKISFYLCFSLVGENSIYINQIQGAKGASVNPKYYLIGVSVIESICQMVGIKNIYLYGSNSKYVRQFCPGTDVDKLTVNKKYDVWANELNYLSCKDGNWYKSLK